MSARFRTHRHGDRVHTHTVDAEHGDPIEPGDDCPECACRPYAGELHRRDCAWRGPHDDLDALYAALGGDE